MSFVVNALRRLTLPLALLGAVLSGPPVAASGERVDVFLVLAVDVSGSIAAEERSFQRDAYREVLRDPEILQAIGIGAHRRIALSYMEWASGVVFDLVVPPRIVQTAADLDKVAQAIEHHDRPGPHRTRTGSTALGGALQTAWTAMQQAPFRAERYVIDISGDGLANVGPWVGSVRDALVWQGVTINGLPLLYRLYPPKQDMLLSYYRDCVIGGSGSFMMPVRERADFKKALKAKMILEIAGIAEPADQVHLAAGQDPSRIEAGLTTICR